MKTSKMVLFASVTVLAVFIYGEYGRSRLPVIPTHTVPRLNAYDYYIRAGDGAERDLEAIHRSESAIVFEEYSLKQKKAIVLSTSPDLKVLRKGFAFPCVCPPLRAGALGYDFAKFQMLSVLLGMEGDVQAGRDNWSGAANSYIDAIKLGVDIAHGSTLRGQLWGFECETIGRKKLWPAISHLTNNQAKGAISRIVSIEANRAPLADSLREQEYFEQSYMLSYYKHFNWAQTMAEGEFANNGIKVFYFGERQQVATSLMIEGQKDIFDKYTRYQDAVIKAVETPYAANVAIEHVPLDEMTYHFNYMRGSNSYVYIVNRFLQTRAVNSQAQNTMLITALELQRYYLDHKKYPKSLSELVPRYVANVPVDPFTLDKPLSYGLVGSKYVLYSVGPDEIDNHGKAIPVDSDHLVGGFVNYQSKGDIVYGVTP